MDRYSIFEESEGRPPDLNFTALYANEGRQGYRLRVTVEGELLDS
jgi:hypothetical protein